MTLSRSHGWLLNRWFHKVIGFLATNNIEGLKTAHYGGTGYVGAGLSYNTLQRTPMGKRVLALQEGYLRKVVDTVADLDKALYEVYNEAGHIQQIGNIM